MQGLNLIQGKNISIHALREEGDLQPIRLLYDYFDFYPRPPRGGRPFSSPPSLVSRSNFYPRPPRGGRHAAGATAASAADISIHALREEGDAAARTSS